MKKITNQFSVTLSRTHVVVMMLLMSCLSFVDKAAAQTVFSQDFSASATYTDYVSATPGSTLFNSITTAGTSVVSITGGALQFTRNNSSIGFARTTDFSPTPTAVICEFDLRVTGTPSSNTSQVATFMLGNNLSTGTGGETNSNVYARFALDTRTGSNFRFNDLTNSATSSSFATGATVRAITWVMNNTGSTISYLNPNGGIETLANDDFDLWVDGTLVFDGANVQTAAQSINDFKFIFTGGTGTIAVDNFSIRNMSTPQVSAFSGNTICSGGTGQLTATIAGGGSPYRLVYSDGTNRTVNGVVSNTAFNAVVNPTVTTNYTLVSVVEANGGARTASFTDNAATITLTSATAEAGANLSMCIGGTSAALGGSVGGTATGGTWSDGGVGGTFNPNANTLNATWTPPGAYSGTATLTLTSTGGACTAATDTKTVTVGTPATVSAGAPFTKTCTTNTTGRAIGETAVAGHTYLWSPTTGLSSSTVANPTANPTSTQTYTVTKTVTATGCTSTAQVTVTVDNTPPVANAGADFTKTCVANTTGAQIGESPEAGHTYSWSPTTGLSSPTIANPIANPGTTQTYTVTKTDTANGCTHTDQVVVTVNNTLSVNAGTDFTKTCTTNPTGRAIGEANVSGNTYSWSPALGLSATNVSNPTANPTTTTTYTVTKTNAANGCVATDEVVVTVNLTTPVANAGADFTKTCVTNPNGAQIGEAAQGGHTYSWSPTTGLSSSTAANPTANPTSTQTYTVTKTNTSSGCTHTDQVTVTVNTTPPTVAALTGAQEVCANGGTTTFASATPNGVWGTSNAAVATVSNGLVTGHAAGTAIINYTATDDVNGCTTTVSRTVTVNPLPASVSASGATSICEGNSTNLTGSATISYLQVLPINSDNFNGTVTYASAGSTGGTANNGYIFTKRNSGTAVGSSTVTNNLDASAFMLVAVTGNGIQAANTASTLTSPSINTTGWGAPLTLTFNHSYRHVSGSGTVQVSANGGAWTTVDTYNSTQGGDSNFVAESISLNSYINVTDLKIRFNAAISVGFLSTRAFWAVENVVLSGGAPIPAIYTWTADTASGVNGLPGAASTPSEGNATISVAPTATTNYTLVAHDPFTGCVQSSSAVTVTVKAVPQLVTSLANQTFCAAASVNAISLSATEPGTTYDISGGAAIGLANATGVTEIPSYTAVAGSATISVTPHLDGCNGTTVTYNVTVNPTPTAVAPATQNYCNGVSVAAIPLSGTPSGVTYDISGGLAIGLADATGVTQIPAYTPSLGNVTVTITPKANGCTGTPVTFNINVNPIVTPTFTPVAAICAGTTLAALPTTSTNGITGTWSPALNNMQTTTYTFTPDSGQCTPLTLTTLEIVVNTNTMYYQDFDGDGYGNAAVSNETCLGQPTGYVLNNTDCDDNNINIYRNGMLYADNDQDSYNDGTPPVLTCYGATLPAGTIDVNNGTDCNDFNAEVNVWHVEVLGNGIDDNCDGHEDEVGPSTTIIPSLCGSTLQHIANLIYVSRSNVATLYRFEVTLGASIRSIDTPNSRFSLLDLPGGAAYNTTYSVRCALQVGGFWQAYGPACNITTPANPATTNVVASQCGATLTSISASIYCNQVTQANQYRFEVSDGVSAARTYETSVNRFNLQQLVGGAQYATTYSVRVALRFGATWQVYGDACNITTPATPPTTNLIAAQCGITINNYWTTLYAEQSAIAQGYRFEVTNGAQVRYYNTTVNRFALRNLTGTLLPNTVYTVRVAILYNNVYQDFGAACNVTTSPSATRIAKDEVKIFDVKTYPNPYVDSFRIDMNTSSEADVAVTVYDMLGRQVETSTHNVNEIGEKTLGANYPSGVYNIIVTQGDNVKTLRVIKR